MGCACTSIAVRVVVHVHSVFPGSSLLLGMVFLNGYLTPKLFMLLVFLICTFSSLCADYVCIFSENHKFQAIAGFAHVHCSFLRYYLVKLGTYHISGITPCYLPNENAV